MGYLATFAIDSFSYALSAVLLLGLPAGAPRTDRGATVGRLLRESPAVLRRILARPSLRTNVLMAVLPMVAIMMSLPNAYGLALQVYQRGPRGFASMEVITAGGWIVGGIIASRVNYKGDRNKYVFWSILGMAACFVGVGVSRDFWVGVALLALGAVANVGVIVGSMTLFQEIEPRPDKGRIIAIRAGFGQMGTTARLGLGRVSGLDTGYQGAVPGLGTSQGRYWPVVTFVPYGVSLRRPAPVPEPRRWRHLRQRPRDET